MEMAPGISGTAGTGGGAGGAGSGEAGAGGCAPAARAVRIRREAKKGIRRAIGVTWAAKGTPTQGCRHVETRRHHVETTCGFVEKPEKDVE
jgi:hypothetical protein